MFFGTSKRDLLKKEMFTVIQCADELGKTVISNIEYAIHTMSAIISTVSDFDDSENVDELLKELDSTKEYIIFIMDDIKDNFISHESHAAYLDIRKELDDAVTLSESLLIQHSDTWSLENKVAIQDSIRELIGYYTCVFEIGDIAFEWSQSAYYNLHRFGL